MQTATNINKGFIATDIAPDMAGTLTYWRLSDGLELAALVNVWDLAGLSDKMLPEAPSDKVAFTRALRAIASGDIKIMRAKDGWWAVMQVFRGDHGYVTTQQVLKARWKDGLEMEAMPGAYTATIETAIRREFAAARGRFTATDLSVWLTKYAQTFGAVSMRDTGGVYFLPRLAAQTWARVADALHQCGQSVFRIPVLKADEAVAAILDAITNETETFCASMASEMRESDALPGVRGMTSKVRQCSAVADKVRMYAEFLDRDLAGLQSRIASVRKVVEARRQEVVGAVTAAKATETHAAFAALDLD